MAAHRWARIATACALAALALSPTDTTYAHGLPPLPLALWGPFGTSTVDCLRHLSQATRRCFHTALTAHRHCIEATLDGQSCDAAARDATIAAARATATATVDAACPGGALTELRFADADDARNDVLLACDEAETTLRMLYAPALNPVVAPGLSDRERSCIAHVGMTGTKLLMATLHDQTRVFDAAAVRVLTPSEKLGRLSHVNERLGHMRTRMAAHVTTTCPSAPLYGREIDDLLALLERRSACVLSAVYFHTSVPCPIPRCGDGVVDSGEWCDDGNGVDSDGCRSDCTAS